MAMRYVIVGAGLSGHQAALELNRLSPSSRIVLVGEEGHLPYDRPPLSKAALLSEDACEAVTFAAATSYAERGIDFHRGARIVSVDRMARTVSTQDGRCFAYDRLLIATGSRPRPLPGFTIAEPGTYLRVIDDSLKLRAALGRGGHLVIVGGGFIGLEVAAAARQRGCAVTVLEASDRLLARGTPEALGDWALRLHRARGTMFELGAVVHHITRLEGGGFEITTNRSTLSADAILVGIGVAPNIELASAIGLEVRDGIVVDDHCRTTDPDIFAAGEVTAHPNRPDGRLRRVESWRTSMDHGVTAARNMVGVETPFDSVPWFWSDQFDQNVQSVGFPDEATRFALTEESTEEAWTLVGLGDDDTIIGAVAVNRGRDISLLKRSMQAGKPPPQGMRLADAG